MGRNITVLKTGLKNELITPQKNIVIECDLFITVGIQYTNLAPIWSNFDLMTSQVLLTLSGGGGCKNAPSPLFFFLNMFKTKKCMTLPFYDFQLLVILNVSVKFLAKILIGSRVIVILSEGYRKIQKKVFFQFFFFLKQLFVQNISSIHYVEVVNIIFFI